MADIGLTKAKEVMNTSNVQLVNSLIAKGWVLINTASGKDETGYPLTMYSLAWCGDGIPQK